MQSILRGRATFRAWKRNSSGSTLAKIFCTSLRAGLQEEIFAEARKQLERYAFALDMIVIEILVMSEAQNATIGRKLTYQ